MTPITVRRFCPVLGILALALMHPACTGTEADNPFTDPTTSSLCKGDSEYVPLSDQREALTLRQDTLDRPLRSDPIPPPVSQLSSLSEIPIWLECVEWDLRDGIFDYQVANFRGGCAVEWTGGGEVTEESNVVVELQNKSCSVAACGNCLYDTRSSGHLKIPEPVTSISFDLVRKDCEGEVSLASNWMLPIAQKSSGRQCREADMWGAMKSESDAKVNNLYAPCDDGSDENATGRECAADLSCVAARCLPACTTDGDCPLQGALTCHQGFCQLPK